MRSSARAACLALISPRAAARWINRADRGPQEFPQVAGERPGVGERDDPLPVLGHGVQDDLGLGVPPAERVPVGRNGRLEDVAARSSS